MQIWAIICHSEYVTYQWASRPLHATHPSSLTYILANEPDETKHMVEWKCNKTQIKDYSVQLLDDNGRFWSRTRRLTRKTSSHPDSNFLDFTVRREVGDVLLDFPSRQPPFPDSLLKHLDAVFILLDLKRLTCLPQVLLIYLLTQNPRQQWCQAWNVHAGSAKPCSIVHTTWTHANNCHSCVI